MIQMPKPFFFEGSQKAIILLHAYASSANDVRMLGRYLQKQDYTVLAPIFTGHATGEPEDILKLGSPEAWWQDTQNAIEFLQNKQYDQISIFGLSLGGVFAMKALEDFPELVGGGSFSSPVVMAGKNNLIPEFLRLASATYSYMKVSGDDAQVRLNWLESNVPSQLAQINTFAATVAAQLTTIKQPTFVAQGGQDELIDASKVYALRDELTNSDVSFHYYEDAGHVITVNNAHHRLEQDLIKYLDKIYK